MLGQGTLVVPYLEESLKLREAIRGPEHKTTIQTMIELGNGLIVAGSRENHDRAEKHLRRALVLSQKDFSDLHTLGLRRLAGLLSVQGKLTESEELYQQVIKIIREQDGADSDSAMYAMATTMYESTFLYVAQGRYEEAGNVQRKVVEILKAHGTREYVFGVCMARLAHILSSQHKYREELELRREILSDWTELLGPIHPVTLKERNNLALCLNKCDEHTEAEEIFRDLLQIWTQTADHKNTLRTMRNLASVLRNIEKCDEAAGIQRDALVRCTKTLGSEHELTISIMSDLSETLFYFDKDDEAKDLLDHGLQLCIKAFGPEDRRPLSVKKLLEKMETIRHSGEGKTLNVGPPKLSGRQDSSEDVLLDLTNVDISEEAIEV